VFNTTQVCACVINTNTRRGYDDKSLRRDSRRLETNHDDPHTRSDWPHTINTIAIPRVKGAYSLSHWSKLLYHPSLPSCRNSFRFPFPIFCFFLVGFFPSFLGGLSLNSSWMVWGWAMGIPPVVSGERTLGRSRLGTNNGPGKNWWASRSLEKADSNPIYRNSNSPQSWKHLQIFMTEHLLRCLFIRCKRPMTIFGRGWLAFTSGDAELTRDSTNVRRG